MNTNNEILSITEANEGAAFISNKESWDVATLQRISVKSLGCVGGEEHIKELLSDEQWQALVNCVAECLKDFGKKSVDAK